MKYKEVFIQSKIINHITLNGKKEISEKLVLQTFKELQRNSVKRFDKLVNVALVLSTPVFKTYKRVIKRRKKFIRSTPALIKRKKARVSLSIRFILTALKNRQIKYFYKKLYEELILHLGNESAAIQMKNKIQEEVLLKKRFFHHNFKQKQL